MKRLVLFDIDGTLLCGGHAAPRAFRDALVATYGTAGPIGEHSFAGKTDPQIARELLGAAGVNAAEVDRHLPDLWRTYTANLARELATTSVEVLSGVHALLDEVAGRGNGPVLGLLTGNIREGARLKLGAAEIDFARFRVGAFGSDHADRPELPAVAVRRAEQLEGHRFCGKEIVVIGDTPADVACGEALGVRTIAVATGSYAEAELAACRPDFVFPSLADLAALCAAIFGEL